jgi:hypothetical protein
MRHLISGLVAAVAVTVAAPAMACGFTPCAAPVYVAPIYSGCNPCGGWAHERLADPDQQYYHAHQYYYVNQGPSYTGPGDWAPLPTYEEAAGYGGGHYGYGAGHYGYRSHYYHRPWHARTGYYHAPHFYHHGYYAPRHAYAPMSHHYGHQPLRRYY